MELTITIKEMSVFQNMFLLFLSLAYLFGPHCQLLSTLVLSTLVKKSNLLNSNRCKQRLNRVDRLIFLAVAAIAT